MKAIYVSGQDKNSKLRQKLLLRYINKKKKECSCIVIGKKVKEKVEFIKKINEMEIPIANGRWLFKYLVIQILEYISKCQNIDINTQRIAILADENNELILYYIKELTKISNKIKIITNHRERFLNIENKLYYESGIVLEISNNKRKALQDVDIIFNFDFDTDKINRYKIGEKSIIVNLKESITIDTKRFLGINVNFYEIDFINRTIDILDWSKEFEKAELYESYIYRSDKIEIIEKDILKDKVIIKNLIGNKGKISEKEYINLLDKTYYLA